MSRSSELLTSRQLPFSEKSSSQTGGWKRLEFGDVCKVQGGFAFKSQEYQKSGIPLVRISNLVNGKVNFDSNTVYLPASKLDLHKDFVLKRGDTLIAMSGATTGKTATFDMDSPALLNQRVGRFRILAADACNPRFISLLVQQITRQVLKEAYGAAQPNISPSQIEQIPIPFPPLEEQNAIVAEIEKQFTRLEAGVAGLRRVQANLKRYRAAVLKAACEGKLVPTEAELARQEGRSYETGTQLLERILTERRQKWNIKQKYKEPIASDRPKLAELPEGWIWASVDQVADIALGRMLDKTKHRVGRDLMYLRNINVRWGSVDTSDLLKMFFEDNQIERYGLCPGDVLVCEGGEPGRAAVWNGQIPGMMYQKALHRVRFYGNFRAQYLIFLLEFLAKTGRLDRWYTGSTIKHFTRESFISLPIPLPPLAEQDRIVAEVDRRLSVVDELEAVVNANLQRATRLRQSVLWQAFQGR